MISSGMPGPSSAIVSSTAPPGCSRGATAVVTVVPGGV